MIQGGLAFEPQKIALTDVQLIHGDCLKVSPGDIWQLGRHRLMCGDATDKTHVAELFSGRKPTLVVTSPPYANQRAYDRRIPCWTSMMLGALNGPLFAGDVQLLINLGITHKKSQWVPYWDGWIASMKESRWRHFGLYIWDKLSGYPGRFPGRMTPSFEFIFHLNKTAVEINRCMPCYSGRKSKSVAGVRGVDGKAKGGKPSIAGQKKPPDSVIRMGPVRFGEGGKHPAQMPISLAAYLLAAYKSNRSICYDPFSGSGTTLLACEQEGVDGLGMEISPAYCQIAIDRWRKQFPGQNAHRIKQGA